MGGAGRIVAVGAQDRRFDPAHELGASDRVDPAPGDPVAAVQVLTGRISAFVVECIR